MSGRVLVFGTFDGLHAGHLFFLKQAKREGDLLFVSVARDSYVRELKNKSPKNNEQERLKTIQQRSEVENAELSDEKLGSFDIIERFAPDTIILGYDQKDLESSLKKWFVKIKKNIPIKFIQQLREDEYGKNMD